MSNKILRTSLDDCQQAAEKRGGRCLSTEYKNANCKVQWRCKYGHIWEASLSKVKQNRWCKICGYESSSKKRKFSDAIGIAKSIAIDNGGKCISNEYINIDSKLLWKCKNVNHKEWRASLYCVKNLNRWCKGCSADERSRVHKIKRLQVAINTAKEKGGRCLSTEYIGKNTKMLWKCSVSSHPSWRTSISVVVNDNCWCPECGNESSSKKMRLKDGLHQAKSIAKKNGGLCLSTEYINNGSKLKWKCVCKNEWLATLSSVKTLNTWCPLCRKSVSKKQEQILKIIRNIYPDYTTHSNYREFNWLRSKANLEIDIFVEDIRLAIEYDGEQHFTPIDFFGGEKAYYERRKMDELKDKLIKDNGNHVAYFIRFNYKQDITYEFIKESISKLMEIDK